MVEYQIEFITKLNHCLSQSSLTGTASPIGETSKLGMSRTSKKEESEIMSMADATAYLNIDSGRKILSN